ncbi:MAG: 30S ribosomal protein S20 [Spirochaetaceae bacterium]|nr:30S ribosomal protein S20 [Spirochaetaceae bacterium]
MAGKGAAKRHIQSLRRRMRNRMAVSEVRTSVKNFITAVDSKNKEEAEKAFRFVVKKIDTAAGKGIFHRNTVARKKSRLAKMLNRLA